MRIDDSREGVQQVTEEHREGRSFVWLDHLWQDGAERGRAVEREWLRRIGGLPGVTAPANENGVL